MLDLFLSKNSHIIFNEKFSEFNGMLLGDGCICRSLNAFCLSGDKILDFHYLTVYAKKLIHDLFGVYPSYFISKKNRSIRCNLYSRDIARYLTRLGFPSGLKSYGNLGIPRIIMKDTKLLARCIRGVMDTDGSLCPHPHSHIMEDFE